MPFCLPIAPCTMLRLMDKIVLAQLRYEVFTYIQDLLIISDSVEQQLEVPSIVASHLTRENLTINVEKWESKSEVPILYIL